MHNLLSYYNKLVLKYNNYSIKIIVNFNIVSIEEDSFDKLN